MIPLDLIGKTASPGPVVSVPTLGSWEYDDFSWKTPENHVSKF